MRKIKWLIILIVVLIGIVFVFQKLNHQENTLTRKNILTRKVLLYYYNPLLDKDQTGNIKCSESGLVPIEREIPLSKTPLKETLNLLLKGKANLNEEDINNGITTEFPLEGFSLKEVNLTPDGTLILKFEDLLNKTVGGSCRVNILRNEILKTAKQFKEVKQVKFLPEELFQP
ncbi:MAG: GerMN domain-containing protein [Minisyncoccia bacterium]